MNSLSPKVRETIALIKAFEDRRHEGEPTLLESDLEALRLFRSLSLPKRLRDGRVERIAKFEKIRLAQLTQKIPTNFHLIDIGLGSGFASTLFCMNSAPQSYFGLDISPSSVDSCLELISDNGIINARLAVLDAMTVEAEEQIGAAARVDPPATCVLLFEVLEHLNNAFEFLRQIAGSLVTDNKLLLTVPLLGKIEHFRTHLQFIPCETLITVLHEAGFEMEEISVIAGTWLFVACRFANTPCSRGGVNVELPRVVDSVNTIENKSVKSISLPSPASSLKDSVLIDPHCPSQWSRIHLAFSGNGTVELRVLERRTGASIATKLFSIRSERKVSFAALGSDSNQHLVFQLIPKDSASSPLTYTVLGMEFLANYPNVRLEAGDHHDE